jgi:hypothetical protein
MPDGWTPVAQGWTPVQEKPVRLPADLPASDPNPMNRIGRFVIDAVKANPATAGAMAGGAIAAPFTGGMSLLPAMAAVGVGSGLGAGAGQVAAGQAPDPSTMVAEGVLGGATMGAGRAIPAVAKFGLRSGLGGAAKIADVAGMAGLPGSHQVASGLRLLQRFTGAAPKAANAANAGGRLVKAKGGQSVESVIGKALDDVRLPAQPRAVSLPPQPTLPPGYKPRVVAPASHTQVAKPATARIRTAPTEPKPAPKAEPKTESALPASWQQFAQPKAPAPRPSDAPLGLSDDAPLWGRSEPPAQPVRDLRGALGAEDAGATLGMEADDVRALSGAAKRRPLVADLADLDLGYTRQLANPLASIALIAALTGRNGEDR